MQIEDGTGKGYGLKIGKEGHLRSVSITNDMPAHISQHEGLSFQCVATHVISGAGTKTVLHIRNDSDTHVLIPTLWLIQLVDPAGGTAVPSINTYTTLTFGETYSSGGTALTPVNLNRMSSNIPAATIYHNNPTLTGTATEFNRHYIVDEDAYLFDTRDTLVLGRNNTLAIKCVTDHTSGTLLVVLRFSMVEIDGH